MVVKFSLHTSIRVLLSLVVQFDLELGQMDVTTAFLYGTLDENIYMKKPPGFEQVGKENMVCHLQKSIYDLKQSFRQWNKCFDSFIASKGFIKNSFDTCVCKKSVGPKIFVLWLLYVDDSLIASNDSYRICFNTFWQYHQLEINMTNSCCTIFN